MKKIFLAVLLLLVLGAAAVFWLTPSADTPPVVTSPNQAPSVDQETPKETVPLAEVIGQLFTIGHWADQSFASTTELVEQYSLGGVIIMSTPEDPAEISAWTNTWQAISKQPLFIAIDQEGGPVSRLKGADFVQTSQREIADEDTAYETGKTRGEELHALGINMNFAPVLDNATHKDSFMYDRVFPNHQDSAQLAAAMISGMHKAGVVAVVKHFPGHADTSDDSHELLPTVAIAPAELDSFTTPFRELLAEHPPTALMTAHVLFSEIDSEPASLSSVFIQDYLRTKLGYTGLIITDDMSMQAITNSRTSEEAAVQALQAGADMILFAAEPELVTQAIVAVEAAVTAGQLTETQLREHYQRILDSKAALPQPILN